MTTLDRDPGLDTLLGLHGQTLFVEEMGHRVKLIVVRTEVGPQRPHGLSYSPTLHGPDGTRPVGFDNAHPVSGRPGPGRADVAKATIGTGYVASDPTTTGMRRRCSQTSGRKWTRF